jgi:hypothetical protein
MSVTIHGIECKNCYDVDWARRVEAEDKKKDEAEAAKKAKEAIAPPGEKPDAIKGADQSSSFDDRPATILDGKLKSAGVDDSGAARAVASSGHIGSSRFSVNIVA